jgi:iron complex outermembrane receptor protein
MTTVSHVAASRILQSKQARMALLGGAAALVLGAPALAQTGTGAPVAAPAGQEPLVGEVIVTAQRRSERLRDVPLSITSQTGAQLARAGVSNLADLTTVVAGLKIDNAGTYVQPALRGVSSVVIGPGTDAPVGVYLDGVYQPNQLANHFDFADISRVEVAKGPQGTLFGRNATGGAVSIFTQAPSFKPTGNLTLGYGNFDDKVAKGFISGPIAGDVLAASLSGYYEDRNGYAYDIVRHKRTRGLESKAVRGKLLFKPTDGISLTFTAAYQDRFDSDATAAIAYKGNTLGRLNILASPATFDHTVVIATRPHDISFDIESGIRLKQSAYSLHGQFDVGAGTVNTISSFARTWAHVDFDEDRAYNPASGQAYIYNTLDDTYSQELTFASRKFGAFSFVLGGYFYKDDNQFSPLTAYVGPFPVFRQEVHNPQLAGAGFGEVNYDLTDRLTLIGGLRYSWERRTNFGRLLIPAVVQGVGPRVTFDSWTPRASIRYKLTDDTNVYATYSKGFKAGGIQSGAFYAGPTSPPQTYAPEKITAYEVGLKSSPSSRLSFNAAAYYYDYKDLQVQVNLTGATQFIQNAASAKIYGLDLDGRWRVTDAFTLSGAASYLHARYKRYNNATVLLPTVVGGVAIGNAPTINGAGVGTYNASGNQLPRAPDFTVSLTADYTQDLQWGQLDLSATGYYSGKVYFDSAERVSQKAYGTLNARAAFTPTGSNVRFEIWGKNLTNTDYLISVYEDATTDGAGYAPPRTFGASVIYAF